MAHRDAQRFRAWNICYEATGNMKRFFVVGLLLTALSGCVTDPKALPVCNGPYTPINPGSL